MINHIESLIDRIEAAGNTAVTSLEFPQGFLALAEQKNVEQEDEDDYGTIYGFYFCGYGQQNNEQHLSHLKKIEETLTAIQGKIDTLSLEEDDVLVLIQIYFAAQALHTITAVEPEPLQAYADALVIMGILEKMGVNEQFCQSCQTEENPQKSRYVRMKHTLKRLFLGFTSKFNQ